MAITARGFSTAQSAATDELIHTPLSTLKDEVRPYADMSRWPDRVCVASLSRFGAHETYAGDLY